MVRQTLIDVDQNLKIPTWEVDSESINLETSQRWRVHKYVGHPVNGEVGGSLAIQVRSVFALEFS